MNIGIVDLDTSHPSSWLPIERELGHTIAGIYDGGAIHPAGYARTFAKEHGIDRVFETLEDMVEHVDMAIIHSCNWDMHVPNARPFIDAGKAVLIDKPHRGQSGGSSAVHRLVGAGPSHRRWFFAALLHRDARLSCPNPLLIAAHRTRFSAAARWICSITASTPIPCCRASWVLASSACVIWPRRPASHPGQFADGRMGLLSVGATSAWLPFHATMVTERASHAFVADSHQLYRALWTAPCRTWP